MSMALWFLLFHILFCLLTTLAAQKKGMAVERYMLPAVWLIPVWGILCVWIAGGRSHIQKNKRRVDVERFFVEDSIYKDVTEEDVAEAQEGVVPLEDALLLNQSKIRRSLIMNLLNDNPQEYLGLLKQARMNDDTEVVHYAVTAMAELSKEYDLEIKHLTEIHIQDPGNREAEERLGDLFQRYLELGLAEGQRKRVILEQYEKILAGQIVYDKKHSVFCKLAQVQLRQKKFKECLETVTEMKTWWPDSEETWLTMLDYYVVCDNGPGIKQLLEEIERQNIYISQEGREKLEFWKITQEEIL